MPVNSSIDFAGVVVFKDGTPTGAEIDAALNHMLYQRKLPHWWR